jgi:hypothetical protein
MHHKLLFHTLTNPLELAAILSRVNLDNVSKHVGHEDYRKFLSEKPGAEHYSLLAVASLAFSG